MKQLNGFYELDGTLLYASQHICAFDPLISEPIPRVKTEYGEKTSTTTLQLGELDLLIEFKSELHGGPLRGREGIKVLNEGQLLIDWAIGGMGHGSNFSAGKKWYIGSDYLLLLTNNGHEFQYRGSSERYRNLPEKSTYLLLFKSYSIPTNLPPCNPKSYVQTFLPRKKNFLAEQIEGLREDIWKAELETPDGPISLIHSRINGYVFFSSFGDQVLYQRFSHHYCRKRTIIKYKETEEAFTSVI